MSVRITLEHILRDEEDDSGQSIRCWSIESERGQVIIRMKHGDGFILMRAADVDLFVADMQRAKDAALSIE